ncbi:hypothetical protein [Hymenobacter lapidiphilus]|nr:hypothetical protein [Hymenobacter lapidiphilus]
MLDEAVEIPEVDTLLLPADMYADLGILLVTDDSAGMESQNGRPR